MKIKYGKYRIRLKHSFGISRSANKWYDILYVYLVDGDIIGRGEAAPSSRYGESIIQIETILKKGITLPKDLSSKDQIWQHISSQLDGIKALSAAFNMAIWDWWGKKQKSPVHALLNVNIDKMPYTSFTIAIGDLDEIGQKVEEAEPYRILKVKLGTPHDDKEIINEIRRHTDKLVRVDANEGWQLESAISFSKWLADLNVEFIEQPFPSNKLNQTAKLKKHSPLDIYADENSIKSSDINLIAHAFDGINIKLMKCGSLDEAKRMIEVAKLYKLKVMMGCMVESSVSVTAAAHLSGDVDKVDLDGNLLIENDPYSGLKVRNGKLVLPDGNGLGTNTLIEKHDLL